MHTKRFSRSVSIRSSVRFPVLRRHPHRRGNSSMELVMATAVALPMAVAMLFLGFKICTYVFSGLSGLLSMPFL